MTVDLIQHLGKAEGRVRHAYQDSLGYWTVGVGHLIDARLGGGLPEHIIDSLLEHDIHNARIAAEKYAWYHELGEARQAVIICMIFNLGSAKFAKFFATQAALARKDYEAAAVQMLASKWATQVGQRAKHYATIMRTGVWE